MATPRCMLVPAAKTLVSRALLGAAVTLCSCTDKVTLGAWLGETTQPLPAGSVVQPSATTLQPDTGVVQPPVASTSQPDTGVVQPTAVASQLETGVPPDDSAAPPVALPACAVAATPGSLNRAGTALGATETITDWTWSAPVESMEWELMVENEIPLASPGNGEDGYYFAQQFSFSEGVTGILGMQVNGGYQVEVTDTPLMTKMLVFWLSGPPRSAELGDIPSPDARVLPQSATGVDWLTIHAKFDWQACHVYRFRFGPESAMADGSVWYGAWVLDKTTKVETFIGRMLLAGGVGQLLPYSISKVSPISPRSVDSCSASPQISVVYGIPSGNSGAAFSTSHASRFSSPTRCPTSRFTEFPGAVRHELGVAQ